jgi:37-kD nucleoid-associated bacterial protein
MIDFNNLLVNRLIIHTINAKQEGQDCATVDPSNEISEIDHNVLEIIRNRLIDAAGRNSKAFELDIDNANPDSFFTLSNDIAELNEKEFIRRTTEIAELLAYSQRRVSIPGGYLLIMDCLDNDTNYPVIIVIKAEPHEALQFSINGGHMQVNVLRKVFLSPSQKLYKIGIIYKKNEDETENINEQFGSFLYDDQFRADTHPAEYFYKDFLGLTVGNNSKIQSQRFYEKTKNFVMTNVDDFEVKTALVLALKNEFTINQNDTINPLNFANTYIPIRGGLRDSYIGDICQELPFAIVKDDSLLKTRLTKRKIDFPSNINLSGPEEGFDNRVEIINQDSIATLVGDNPDYTVIKIMGKPYSSNE